MKFLIQLLVTAAVCALLQTFFPWWSLAVGCVAVGYGFDNGGFRSFAAGFLAVGLLWVGLSAFIDFQTASILTQKINRLLPVNAFLLTGMIGALVGGFASLTGALAAAKPKRKW
ncbi:MAG: hypothetical protein MUC38_14560 [Cyclobacteriaceae bacterium]|jgi:hypothetical protein|nr:hypothetical protein [Cyclobacteriaceae bacterium]